MSEERARAPRWRAGLAGLLDVGLVGVVTWLSSRGRGGAAEAASRLRWLRLIPAEALREQLGTPGQRLLGLRTVDRRTGRRVALWRSLALTAVAAGGQQLARRVAPPTPSAEEERQRESYLYELRAIHQRHPAPSHERSAEIRALQERHGPAGSHLARSLAPALAAGLLTARLRRRLAPTVEILVRRRGDHRP